MPQPVEISGWSGNGKGPVMQRPACAIRIAAVISEWTRVESSLTNLLSHTMGSHTVRDDGGINVSTDWNMQVIMDEIESIQMRLKIVDNVLAPRLPDDLKIEWDSLKKKIRSGAKQRNLVAHASWIFSELYPDDFLLRVGQGPIIQRYQAKDFDDMLERISAISSETWYFMNKVFEGQRTGAVRR